MKKNNHFVPKLPMWVIFLVDRRPPPFNCKERRPPFLVCVTQYKIKYRPMESGIRFVANFEGEKQSLHHVVQQFRRERAGAEDAEEETSEAPHT